MGTFSVRREGTDPRYLINDPPDKQTVKAPLSDVNLLERSATYLAKDTASSSFSKTSTTALFLVSAIDDFTTSVFLGLAVTEEIERPVNERGLHENLKEEGGSNWSGFGPE